MLAASQFANTTTHGANDVQHNITVLCVVISLFVSGPEK
jgi:hypothetical protein